jgi:hypothetical protein
MTAVATGTSLSIVAVRWGKFTSVEVALMMVLPVAV